MTADDKIQFRLTLGSEDWEEGTSGWRCPALRIPTATVETVWSTGEIVDTARYRVELGQQLIRWAARPTPDKIVVGISVSGNLPTEERLERLERAKMKWAVVGPIGGALIGGVVALIIAYSGAPKSSVANDITKGAGSSSPSAGIVHSDSTLPTSTSVTSASAVARSSRCPDPPRPDVKLATEPYIVEVAQATNQAVQFHELDKVALVAADKLGDKWKNSLVTAPGEKAYRRIDDTQRFVYVARWYGLSRSVANGICCYLDEHGWNSENSSIKQHCIAEPQAVSKPAKTLSSTTGK